MNGQPKVSIIMPSLNVVEYIQESVESVINQTLKDIEIICVDAGSTDGTREILQEYTNQDSRITIIDSDRKSYGYQMNLGLDAASGEYIGIVETDDFVKKDMYEELYKIAKAQKLDFIKSDFYRFVVNQDKSLKLFYYRLTNKEDYYNVILEPGEDIETFRFVMNTWSGIYNTEFLRKWNIRHNETPGASYQDNGFWFQTFCRAKRVLFYNKPFYMNRRDNPNSSIYSKSKIYCMKNEYDYIRSIIDADSENLNKFIPLCNFFRFCGYYYNTLFRISPELRSEFLESFSREFKKYADNNELDLSLFSTAEKNVLLKIMYETDYFCQNFDVYAKPLDTQDFSCEMRESLVSVIVPVYNVQNYLAECLDSLRLQSYQNIEILCVNDGSTDGSLEILNSYAEKDKRIRIFSQENRGLSAARNTGLSKATGEYVFFVDSDDTLAPGAVEKVIRTARRESADIVVFGIDDYYAPRGQKMKWLKLKNPTHNVTYRQFRPKDIFFEESTKPFACRDCYRRDFLEKNHLRFLSGLLFGEDTVFQMEAFPNADTVVYMKGNLYRYRTAREGSLMSNYDSNMAQKTAGHIFIVSYLQKSWEKIGILNQNRAEFASWAMNFMFGEWQQVGERARAKLAREIVAVMNDVTCNKYKAFLGSGGIKRMELLTEIGATYSGPICQEKKSDEILPHEECGCPRVSIVVPSHNMERFLPRCMYSLLSQTLEEIEVICVDDGSTDDTSRVLDRFAQKDKRLTVITYPTVKTANQARKDAVLAARGEYILFCDADDTLEPDAAQSLYEEMRKKPVDILHFGTNIINENGSPEDEAWLEEHLLPYNGFLRGEQVFDGCYREDLFSANLWNKMYDASLAKMAFSKVEDGAFPRGQDIYAFVLLAYYAKSYRGLTNCWFYNYHLGCGGDGTKTLSYEEFPAFCTFPKVIDALERFFEGEGKLAEYSDAIDKLRSRMLGDCVNKWYNKVSSADKGRCFDCMAEVWPAWRLVESVARRYWDRPDKLFEQLGQGSTLKKVFKQHPHTIGMYYHKLSGGGVERVMEYLSKIWTDMDYAVVILTDIQGPEDYVELPDGVKRYAIPNYGIGRKDQYWARAKRISEIIELENIDVMVYHAWNTGLLPFDMLTVKANHASFVIHCHSVFTLRLREGADYFSKMPAIYSFADAVVCLSKMDCCYWKQFNANVFTVVNPVGRNITSAKPASLEGRKILWVGRCAPEKRPEDAIRIFSKVLRAVPDATLEMLGDTGTEENKRRLKDFAEAEGCAERVEFLGFHEDVVPFYQSAAVVLMTSEYEGFPLNLLEAKTCGIPVVMYELPYLTLAEGERGIRSCPFGQVDEMAQEVVDLLCDRSSRLAVGREGRSHALEILAFDFCGAWGEIFQSLGNEREDGNLTEIERMMWRKLLSDYSYGINHVKRPSAKRPPSLGKVRGFFKCLGDNGVKYTWGRLKVHARNGISGIKKSVSYCKKYGLKQTLRRIKREI